MVVHLPLLKVQSNRWKSVMNLEKNPVWLSEDLEMIPTIQKTSLLTNPMWSPECLQLYRSAFEPLPETRTFTTFLRVYMYFMYLVDLIVCPKQEEFQQELFRIKLWHWLRVYLQAWVSVSTGIKTSDFSIVLLWRHYKHSRTKQLRNHRYGNQWHNLLYITIFSKNSLCYS